MPFSDPKYRRSQRATPLLPKDRGGAGGEFDGASFTGAVFNLSTTIVGAGIMALPATLKQLGAIPGLITILLAGMLTGKSIEIILRFSKAAKTGSYSGLAADAFSGAGRNILQLCIVMNNVGMLVVYMIIIGIAL
ncbi:Amino acid transporter AVT6A [Sesamum angolense]|uniref:Amino acid transporter AVT6A n=1 Tax=Sesamum angolense TaxID=2727404 RepID=A0AAE2BM34_9LAMI|nr:Amino acid transporter AVT6A [Sesamum angolense]